MKWLWEACPDCTGQGKVWPCGPDAPAERCQTCRGIGRMCTVNAGFLFDKQGHRVPGKSGLHPIGDCLDCCGLLTRVVRELNTRTMDSLDLADQNRAQRRDFESKVAQAGSLFEQRLQNELTELTQQVKQLTAIVAAPKQLTAGEGGSTGTPVAVSSRRKKK